MGKGCCGCTMRDDCDKPKKEEVCKGCGKPIDKCECDTEKKEDKED